MLVVNLFADIQTYDILKINNIYLNTVYIFLCVSRSLFHPPAEMAGKNPRRRNVFYRYLI